MATDLIKIHIRALGIIKAYSEQMHIYANILPLVELRQLYGDINGSCVHLYQKLNKLLADVEPEGRKKYMEQIEQSRNYLTRFLDTLRNNIFDLQTEEAVIVSAKASRHSLSSHSDKS